MKTRSEFWEIVEPIVVDEGLALFDLEVSGRTSKVLRVFICDKDKHSSPITLDSCSSINRRLRAVLEVDDIEFEDFSLEVSSPGINRKLRRDEHFEGALGERVRLVLYESQAGSRALLGEMSSFSDGQITVEDEEQGSSVSVLLSNVKEARVDFLFS